MLYRGIDCYFTDGSAIVLDTEEKQVGFIDHFLKHTPINSIEWVSKSVLDKISQENPTELPIYVLENGTDTLLVWPVVEEADLHLIVANLTEQTPEFAGILVAQAKEARKAEKFT
jgi:hypothetical protein